MKRRRLRIVIPTVPSRAALRAELERDIERAFVRWPLYSVELLVSRDDAPGAPGFVPRQARAMLGPKSPLGPVRTPWVLWLDDDAELCARFAARLADVMDAAPEGAEAIGLFDHAPATHAPGIHPSTPRGVATLMTGRCARALPDRAFGDNYEASLREAARAAGGDTFVTMPSLVDHRGEVSALTGGFNTYRAARLPD
ncbi:MAG: hypothetical protein ACOCUS_00045 [Polyangiales bacterium]